MATEVNARGAYVKIRHPWGAFFLVIITLGIYYLFWYFFINRELRDFGQASADEGGNRIEVNPWLSLLAVTLGVFLIVPPFVSMYRTFKRVRTAQEIAGRETARCPRRRGFRAAEATSRHFPGPTAIALRTLGD